MLNCHLMGLIAGRSGIVLRDHLTLGLLLVVLFIAFGCGDHSQTAARRDTRGENAGSPQSTRHEDEHRQNMGAPASIEGTWGWVSGEKEGVRLMIAPAHFLQTFEGNKLTIGIASRNESSEMTIEFHTEAEPKQYDVTAGGGIEQGIYRIDGDLLTLCAAKPPWPRPTEFSTSRGNGRSLMVFRRMRVDKLASPVSREEALSFANELERAAASGDEARVNSAFDIDGILDRSTTGFGLSENSRLSFIDGVRENSQVFGSGIQLGAVIAQAVANGGQYDCVRVHPAGDQMRMLFRLLTPYGGAIYHDLILGRTAYGELKAVDVNLVAMGERLSDMLRRALLPWIAQSPEFNGNLGEADKEYIRCADEFRRLGIAGRSKRFSEAYEIYRELPQSVQHEVFIQLLVLKGLQGDQREALLKECSDSHPGELAFELLKLEGYVKNHESRNAQRTIDRLESRLEGDPYCNVVRARVFESENDLEAAKNAAEKAIKADARLKCAYVVLVSVALKRKEYEAAIKVLSSFEKKFATGIKELPSLVNYRDFVESAQYKAWRNTKR